MMSSTYVCTSLVFERFEPFPRSFSCNRPFAMENPDSKTGYLPLNWHENLDVLRLFEHIDYSISIVPGGLLVTTWGH